jgi:protein-L-isoaspartate(D-aspartate) O-methyltransferase
MDEATSVVAQAMREPAATGPVAGPAAPTPDFAAMREAMVDSQLRPTGVNDPAVVGAFRAVPREAFVPAPLRALAYLDEDLTIAPGRALIEPMIIGNLLQRAAPGEGDRALILPAGSGYEAAVLARLAGRVTALEADPALAARARAALALHAATVELVEGPLEAGWPAHAPYDLIVIAGAIERLPEALAAQLANGGRIAAVMVDERGVGRASIGRRAGGVIGFEPFMDVATIRLPGFERPRVFQF